MQKFEFLTLSAIVEQLSDCDYRNEAGPLQLNKAFIALRECAQQEQCGAPAGQEPCGDCAWCRLFLPANGRSPF